VLLLYYFGEGPLNSLAPDRPESLARSATKGFIWVFLTSGLGKVAGLIAHLALGWFLLDEHWGVYSIALSIAVFAEILRNGGVAQLVVSRGPEGYQEISGPAFWIAALLNLCACLFLIVISPLAARYYNQPDLAPLIIAAGVSFILGTPTAILRSKLQVELRFPALALVAMVSSIVRAFVLIVAAYAGAQALTFMWAFLIFAASESLFHWLATHDSPWLRAPAIRSWPHIIRNLGSLMIGNFLLKFAGRADYLVLSVLIGVGMLGQYMFAYELVYQLGALIIFNFQNVLFPVLNRFAYDTRRLQKAVERSVGALVMLVAAPAYLFAVLARPLELLLWQGKWARAVEAMEIFALSEPLRAIIVVAHCLLLAQARFEARIFLMLGACVSVIIGALAGGFLFEENLRGIALVCVIIQAIFVLPASGFVLKHIGCDLFSLAVSIVMPVIVAGLSAIVATMVSSTLFAGLVPLVLELLLVSAVFVLVFLLLSRLILHQHLFFVASIMANGRMRRAYCRVLYLENPTDAAAKASKVLRL